MSVTRSRVTQLLMEYLPSDVEVSFQDAETYIRDALLNPLVQFQVQIGIYDLDSIKDEFLGVMKSVVPLRLVVVCLPLIHNQLDGLNDDLAEGYVRYVAAHEAHHFEHGHTGVHDIREHIHRERDCNDLVDQRYPQLALLRAIVERESPVIQRVLERIRHIQKVGLSA